MNPELIPPEPASPPTGSSALGALLVVSSLLVACGLYAYGDRLRPSTRAALERTKTSELSDPRATTRTIPRLPAKFVA